MDGKTAMGGEVLRIPVPSINSTSVGSTAERGARVGAA